MNKKVINSQLKNKAKNNNSIRVIHKKAGQLPTVKIIPNIFTLKKTIIKRNLDIIPYESLYIICNSKPLINYMQPNIALPFRSVKGDLLLVDIDKKEREFKGISQEDIIWYVKDLIDKSYNNNNTNNLKPLQKETREKKLTHSSYNERGFEYGNSTSFEKSLIQVLVNIEIVLASMLKTNRNGDMKNG